LKSCATTTLALCGFADGFGKQFFKDFPFLIALKPIYFYSLATGASTEVGTSELRVGLFSTASVPFANLLSSA